MISINSNSKICIDELPRLKTRNLQPPTQIFISESIGTCAVEVLNFKVPFFCSETGLKKSNLLQNWQCNFWVFSQAETQKIAKLQSR